MTENDTPQEKDRQVVVSDPEDFNRAQRFKEIHDARQRVTEFLSEMEVPDKGGATYRKREATRLGYLVSSYIIELEPLIEKSGIDTSKILQNNDRYDGLGEFAFSLGVNRNDDEKGSETPAPQESMRMFSAANRFYSRVGMDLDVGEETGDSGFDYSDILEEGPPSDGDAPDITADGVDE